MSGRRAAFVARLARLLNDYREQRPDLLLEVRPFFSGAAAYVEGHIFMSLTPVGLAFKLPAESRRRLLDEGAVPLRYFPKAPVKKSYVLLTKEQAEDRSLVFDLIGRSVAFAIES